MLTLRRAATRAAGIGRAATAMRSTQRKAFSSGDAPASATAPVAPAAAVPSATAPTAAAVAAAAVPARHYTPVYLLPVPASLPEYDWEDVHAHNSPDPAGPGYWIVIDDHIYDVSRYARFHPGGDIATLFARGHGRDRGRQFGEVHGIKEKNVTQRFCVGRIKAGSVNKRQAELDEKERREEAEADAREAAAAAVASAATGASSSSSSGDSTSGR